MDKKIEQVVDKLIESDDEEKVMLSTGKGTKLGPDYATMDWDEAQKHLEKLLGLKSLGYGTGGGISGIEFEIFGQPVFFEQEEDEDDSGAFVNFVYTKEEMSPRVKRFIRSKLGN